MSETSIPDFFKQKIAGRGKPPRDWAAKKKAFVAEVDALFETIEREYLKGAGVAIVLQPGRRWGVVQGMRPTLRVVPRSADSLLALLGDVMRP